MYLPLLISCLVGQLILEGAAAKLLWGWFLVPTLGLPVISFMQTIGIVLLADLLVERVSSVEEKIDAELLFASYTRPVMIMAFGFFVHLMM